MPRYPGLHPGLHPDRHLGPRGDPCRAWRRLAAGLAFAAALGACGSDDVADGGDPAAAPAASPATPLAAGPHALQAQQSEADALALKTADTAIAAILVAQDVVLLEDLHRLTRWLLPRIGTEADGGTRASIDCRRNPLSFAPVLCFGAIRFEADRRETQGTIRSGTLFALRFDDFQVLAPGFERLRVDGGFELGYRTDVGAAPDAPASGTIRYDTVGLGTNREGETAGPSQGSVTIARTDADGSRRLVVEAGNERFVDVDVVEANGVDGRIRSGTVRTNFGGGYVDIAFDGWSVAGSEPQPGASARVTGADGTGAQVQVVAVTASAITWRVDLASGGTTRSFDVSIPRGRRV